MTDPLFEIRLLGKEDRSDFCCGSELLDRYLTNKRGCVPRIPLAASVHSYCAGDEARASRVVGAGC